MDQINRPQRLSSSEEGRYNSEWEYEAAKGWEERRDGLWQGEEEEEEEEGKNVEVARLIIQQEEWFGAVFLALLVGLVPPVLHSCPHRTGTRGGALPCRSICGLPIAKRRYGILWPEKALKGKSARKRDAIDE